MIVLFSNSESINKMQSPEDSSAPTGRGLKSILAKARAGRNDDASTKSTGSSENNNDNRGFKDTMENALDRMKTLARRDNDSGSPTTNGAVSKKLLSEPLKRMKQKRQARKANVAEGAEPRNKSIGGDSLPTPEGDSRTQSAAGDDDDNDGSSMMTGDSEDDSS